MKFGGVALTVDRMSAPYVQGATIDFVDTIEKQGFTIDNPQRHRLLRLRRLLQLSHPQPTLRRASDAAPGRSRSVLAGCPGGQIRAHQDLVVE